MGPSLPDWSELELSTTVSLGDVGTFAAALVALLALLFTWVQIRHLAQQSRATLLLTLDERWESKEMAEDRQCLNQFKRSVREEAEKKSPPVTAASLFPASLKALRTDKPEDYARLFHVVGFFEMLAFSARAGYLRVNDVHGLYAPAIRDAGSIFGEPIRAYQAEYGILDAWGNFLWLVGEIRKLDELKGLSPRA